MSQLPPPAPPQPPGGTPPSYPSPSTPPPAPPPGYAPYSPVQAVQPYRPVGRIAGAIIILLGLTAAFQVITIPVLVALHRKAQQFRAGRITEDTFKHADDVHSAVTGFQSLLAIAGFVLVIIWMHRLAQNHRALGRPDSTWAPGWAIGGWFVPPGFIYAVPWLMFRELWKGSDPQNVPNDPTWKRRPVSWLLTAWWVLHGFLPVVTMVVTATVGYETLRNFTNQTPDDIAKLYTHFFAAQLVVAILSVVGTAVYIKVVHDLTARQRALTGEA